MNYGITTVHTHLDSDEIDYVQLKSWLELNDMGEPIFGGRYFLGHASKSEVDAGSGFCLWAHGEGAEGMAPRKIVPIQRADPERQSTVGKTGYDYGSEDGKALAAYIDSCRLVGDLQFNVDSQILTFLEVDDNTELSIEYWTGWASYIYNAPLSTSDTTIVHIFLPGIFCAFEFDNLAMKFLPDPKVRACLARKKGFRGDRSACSGFWARRFKGASDPAHPPLSWENLGMFAQQSEIPGATNTSPPVTVYFLRLYDAPVWPIPETLDMAASGDADPLNHTLTATTWAADSVAAIPIGAAPNFEPPLTTVPSQLGIDRAEALTVMRETITWLISHDLTAKKLPYDPKAPKTLINVKGPCKFVFRYYSEAGSGKVLTRSEAIALSNAGIGIGVCWEGRATTTAGLIRPFLVRNQGHTQGHIDAVAAFTYAAETIDQRPYTPVFFAVDFPIDSRYSMRGEAADEEATPPIENIIDYFQDVQRGYREYLVGHPAKPYYVGVYGQVDVSAALYRLGLASHFWQTPWALWGNSGRPFRHLNAWQIALSGTEEMADDNAIMKKGGPPPTENDPYIWFDLDVAWGDPGTFRVYPS